MFTGLGLYSADSWLQADDGLLVLYRNPDGQKRAFEEAPRTPRRQKDDRIEAASGALHLKSLMEPGVRVLGSCVGTVRAVSQAEFG